MKQIPTFSLLFVLLLVPSFVTATFDLEASTTRQLITNGVNVTPGTYPFFAFNKFGRRAGCGASLIHSDILLTAAHCKLVFHGRGAYVGAATNFGFDDGEFHEDDGILQHPMYREEDFSNDIMLVKLQTPSQQTPISIINRDTSKPKVGQNLTVMGFGDTEFKGDMSPNLLETHVFASDFEACAELYLNESEAVLNETTQFCALGEDGRDACQADSGGPVIIKQEENNDDDDAVQLVGIISYGLGCGQEDVPAVFVRISSYLDWIEDGICQLSANPPSSCNATTNSNTTLANETTTEPGVTSPPATEALTENLEQSSASLKSLAVGHLLRLGCYGTLVAQVEASISSRFKGQQRSFGQL